MEKKIELKFDESQLNNIILALAEIPYKFAAPVLEDINKQLKEQKDKNGGGN